PSRLLTSSIMSLANYDNTRSKTGDINSIPDEIIMEWCRYMNPRSRVKFGRSCKRIARLEREAGERIVDSLDIFILKGDISLMVRDNCSKHWRPDSEFAWINRARVRYLPISSIEARIVDYSSQFIRI
ncbi:hypothetical protein PFISCL1PPCAC_11923, partial [Pristionchus fissidentatus]